MVCPRADEGCDLLLCETLWVRNLLVSGARLLTAVILGMEGTAMLGGAMVYETLCSPRQTLQ